MTFTMQKHLKYCSGMFIATLSLAACVSSTDDLNQQYVYQDKNLKQQCLAQLQTLQQSSVPLYYDEDDKPVYRDLPAIEPFHCSIVPEFSQSIPELKKRER